MNKIAKDKNLGGTIFSEDDNFLREFYQQLPLGVSIEDYSLVKKGVDEILRNGVEDLEQHLKDNPDVLYDLVWEIKAKDANLKLLKLFKCETLQQYLELDDDYDHWKDTGWAEYYTQEIVHFTKNETHFGDYIDSASDGSRFECRCVGWVPSGYQDTWAMVITTHDDITSERLADREILKQRDELKLLNTQKNEFFAIVAHDLKSPFNALKGFSYLLDKNSESLSRAEIKEYGALINRSAEEAHDLVEDLLDWAMVQFDQLEILPKSLAAKKIIQKNISRYKTLAKSKDITIKMEKDCDIKVYADGHMIDTIIRNLVVNAIKFTPQSGTITIRSAIDNNTASINITDDGVGMSPGKIKNLFQLDKKVQSKGTDGETGTGIGLHLSKKMALLNGGTIQVDSVEGEGSTFSLVLPLQSD